MTDLTVQDVTNVENSRMLKRNGAPQHTHAYWQGIMPSLSTIQGMASIATEKKGKMQWNLVLERPTEPYASAYTLEELQVFLKAYSHDKEKPLPEVKKSDKLYTCSINDKTTFTDKTEVDAFALAVISIIKGV